VVFGEVIRIHVRDDVVLPGGKLDIAKIEPIARMGYYDYAVIRDTFEMQIPNVSDAVLAVSKGGRRPRNDGDRGVEPEL
jgi:hypothetical protein